MNYADYPASKVAGKAAIITIGAVPHLVTSMAESTLVERIDARRLNDELVRLTTEMNLIAVRIVALRAVLFDCGAAQEVLSADSAPGLEIPGKVAP